MISLLKVSYQHCSNLDTSSIVNMHDRDPDNKKISHIYVIRVPVRRT